MKEQKPFFPFGSQNLLILSEKNRITSVYPVVKVLVFCPECGTHAGDDDLFCENCGSALPKRKSPGSPEPLIPPPPSEHHQPLASPPPPPVLRQQTKPQSTIPPPPPPEPVSATTPPVIQTDPSSSLPRKSPGLAALGSFFLAGLGQTYNGQTGKGVAVFLGTLIGALLFFVPGVIVWVYGIADAFTVAKKMNEGKVPFRQHTWIQIISFVILACMIGYLVYSVLMLFVEMMIEEGLSGSMMMPY
jgi:TM2 domain-containing membrane protein YozV